MWPQQQVKIDKNPHTHVYLLFHMSVLIVSCKLHEISTGTFLCVLLILCEWPSVWNHLTKVRTLKDDLSASTLSAASSSMLNQLFLPNLEVLSSGFSTEAMVLWSETVLRFGGSVWNVWPGFMKRLSDLESLQWNTLVYITRSWREWLILLF